MLRQLSEQWPFVLAVAASAAGLTAFVVNLLTIRKIDLEIRELQREREQKASAIQLATAAEIAKYGAPVRQTWASHHGPLLPRMLALGAAAGIVLAFTFAVMGVRIATYVASALMLGAALLSRDASTRYSESRRTWQSTR